MTAWVLLWMSLSYGITNFTMMWLALKKSRNLLPITGLIVLWWLCCPLISVAGGEMNICTFRTTDRYHWIMAVILFVGYFILIMLNLFGKKNISILYLFAVGFLIQFFLGSGFAGDGDPTFQRSIDPDFAGRFARGNQSRNADCVWNLRGNSKKMGQRSRYR